MFNDLRAFHHVAETGSYRKAAEAMGVSRPNISYHVSKLEKTIRKQLLIRGRPIQLTLEGKALAVKLRNMMWFYERLEQDLLNPSVGVSLTNKGFGRAQVRSLIKEINDSIGDGRLK